MAPPEGNPNPGGFNIRVVSAAILAPVVLAVVYGGTPFFEVLIAAAALIMAFEWNRMCDGRPGWLVVGAFYIGIPCWALLSLRADPVAGRETLFWLLAIVWSADTGAYAFGRLIGGPKLAPFISPNKTWAGFAGGVGSAAIVGIATALAMELTAILPLAGWSALIGAVSQGGDLVESWVKRHFSVKDTGTIIPGHGGLLDRVDGLLIAAIGVFLISLVGEGSILTWM
ncbi:MAG: phosphatidate cytidylyltransferase [Alphaproteobacteria bacterium]|jgi:phosphatidate cytidylyltransferase|nr:phosphatidate cytidylyltransferase [Alphaproteobacteria bacterium]MBT7942109.1 phosphatidate cytidylyltransferase [Alphaproteobacteria bacterium]